MGCDIHFFTEVKIKGVWYTYGHPDIARWYELFGVLAGVRVEGVQLFPVKGFPADASEITKAEYADWRDDAHTPSYLTLEEIKRFYEWYRKTTDHGMVEAKEGLGVGYLGGSSWYDLPDWCDGVRWVFWFDN